MLTCYVLQEARQSKQRVESVALIADATLLHSSSDTAFHSLVVVPDGKLGRNRVVIRQILVTGHTLQIQSHIVVEAVIPSSVAFSLSLIASVKNAFLAAGSTARAAAWRSLSTVKPRFGHPKANRIFFSFMVIIIALSSLVFGGFVLEAILLCILAGFLPAFFSVGGCQTDGKPRLVNISVNNSCEFTGVSFSLPT